MPEIETDQLRLRPFTTGDFQDYHQQITRDVEVSPFSFGDATRMPAAHFALTGKSPLRGIQNSKFIRYGIEDPIDESRGLNKAAPHFLFSITEVGGL